ncbi:MULTISPECIES: DUF2564 family protein [Alteribacter]|uniref:DUF2564 family protein n=1 Tax=Alteribacter keqinensis TaxID=2483800 RepID=A0A3M7TUT2_9BACI|nr:MULTISPECIES: DUF2564 family protein [Alteribacter]MBM7094372.1 DUF2564 family protein [Alteribacter salitolerans]RNA69400.1 DUF2564 family protein [Alteribacter keqinensis]
MSQPFNDIQQVEMAIKAAQKMVGQATMSMNPEQLETATNALNDAKNQLHEATKYEMSGELGAYSHDLIEKLESQLEKAKDEE